MIRIVYISLLFIALISCSYDIKNRTAPDDLIPRDKMVEIIKELVKIEAFVKIEYPAVTQFHKAIINSGDSLFKAHGVTHEEFDVSLDYYGFDQVEMKGIYSDALDQLNHELGQLESGK